MQMKEPEEYCMSSEEGLDYAEAASLHVFVKKKKIRQTKPLNVTAKSVHARQNTDSKRAAQTGWRT